MKKWLLIGILVIVAIFGISLGFSINKANDKKEELYSFRDYVDKEYTPTFEKSNKHFNDAADAIPVDFADWYLLHNGFEENSDLQSELKEAREKIVNKDVKYPDTLEYKKIILNQISLLEEGLETLDSYSTTTAYDFDEIELLGYRFGKDIKKLSKNVEEMSKILGKYYE